MQHEISSFAWLYLDAVVCKGPPTTELVLGIALCVAGTLSYFPQYYSLIKSRQSKGISELSLFILNLGSACLLANIVILNWFRWQCYSECGFWVCTGNLLPVWQIAVGWIMVVPLYLIFIRFKRLHSERHCAYDLAFLLTYVLFIMLILIVSLAEELSPTDSREFFIVFSKILGIVSAISSCVVWIPQIVKLIRTKNQGSLSLVMFIFQAPGNVIIIVFQAVLAHQDWSTWITYLVCFIEQTMIVIILIVLKCRDRHVHVGSPFDSDSENLFTEQEAEELDRSFFDRSEDSRNSESPV